MKRVIIFGNSGSGKSTKAKHLCSEYNLSHLDLDTLAWLRTDPPQRKPINDSKKEILSFLKDNDSWVIEGCYSDLLEIVLEKSSEIIYMKLSVEDCIENAKKRPWEPHKYISKDAQDENLEMLIEWIKQYPVRDDTFSKVEHEKIYHNYKGKKLVIEKNSDN